jgi:hypothetical protein
MPKCKCGESNQDNFYKDKSRCTGYTNLCKKCHNKKRLTNMQRYRPLALKAYSDGKPCCVCCGEDKVEFLVIDHVDGGGNKQRKELGRRWAGTQFFRWLHLQGYPKGYRVLCHNCNFSLGAYGYCPHHPRKGKGKVGLWIKGDQPSL